MAKAVDIPSTPILPGAHIQGTTLNELNENLNGEMFCLNIY